MIADKFIRNFQLSILADIKLGKPFSSIYDDLKLIFKNLNIYKNIVPLHKSKLIYTKSGDDVYISVFCSNNKNDIESIWINNKIITRFQMKYSFIDYVDMKEIIIWYLKFYFKNVDNNQFFFSSEEEWKLKDIKFELKEKNVSL